MTEDKRITRKQAQGDTTLKNEIEKFYTEPFVSTPLPKDELKGRRIFPTELSRVLFLENDPNESYSDSSAIDKTEH